MVKDDFYIFRSFRPPLAEDEDWYDPMLNPFSDNNCTESEGDDHYETIDDVQLAVAELQRHERQRSDSQKLKNMPNDKEKRTTNSGYSKIGGASQKVGPPRPKRPASIISAERPEATSVEPQTSFDQDESNTTVIPKIVISEKEQMTKPSEEEGRT